MEIYVHFKHFEITVKAVLTKDGGRWRVSNDENSGEGVSGFGPTTFSAIDNFRTKLMNLESQSKKITQYG